MSGGIATLEILQETGTYDMLEKRSAALAAGLAQAASDANVPIAINRVGSMIGLFFVKRPGDIVTNYIQATSGDTSAYARFFHAMLNNGIYLAPGMYEAIFVGTAHTEAIIEQTIAAAAKSFQAIAAL